MTEPDPVLDALLTALAANDHPDLRAAIGRHLAGAGRHAEALGHLQAALTADPADVDLLALAATAAEQGGEPATAAGYRQLLAALAPPTTTTEPPAPAAPPTAAPPGAPTAEPPAQAAPPTAGPPGAPPAAGPPGAPPDVAQSPPAPAPPGAGSSPSGGGPSAGGPGQDETGPIAIGPLGGEPPRLPAESGDDDDFDSFLKEVIAEDRAERVRLSDVGGMRHVKDELERRFFMPLRNPEIRKAFGKSVAGGLLLYGPPGCGKTFLARAIAGELDARFVPVTLHDTLDMWLGQSEQNLHAIFDEARSETPTVLFLDEVDAIGQKRSKVTNSSMRSIVAQLLNELDGAVDRNDGVFVIAATNAPWDVDPALRRPGRFDRTVLVLPPDEEARASILELHLRDRPAVGLDVGKVAAKTRNLSGADLKLICDTAVELAMERSVKSGRVEPIDQKLLDKAAKSVKPSVGPWLDTARNFVSFANQSGEYDELEMYLSSQKR